MHDSVLVRVGERLADRGADAQASGVAQLLALEPAREIATIDEIGDHVDVVLVLDHAPQLHDVRVVEAARDRNLAPRTLTQRRLVRDRLDGDRALRLEIEAAEDRAGASDAEHAVDAESVADDALGKERRRRMRNPGRHQRTSLEVRGDASGTIANSGTVNVVRQGKHAVLL